MVDLLVKRGAKVDAEDVHGHNAAFYAREIDDQAILSSLESAPPVATWDISKSLTWKTEAAHRKYIEYWEIQRSKLLLLSRRPVEIVVKTCKLNLLRNAI